MNDTDAERLIRVMTGYWPTPALKPEEALVWSQTLARCQDANLAGQVLQSISDSGELFRPPAGAFRKAYNDAMRNKHLGVPVPGRPELEAPAEQLWDDESHLPRPRGDRVASPEFNAAWSQHVKAKLASMTGPFSRNLADAIKGERAARAPERSAILDAVESIKEEGWKA